MSPSKSKTISTLMKSSQELQNWSYQKQVVNWSILRRSGASKWSKRCRRWANRKHSVFPENKHWLKIAGKPRHIQDLQLKSISRKLSTWTSSIKSSKIRGQVPKSGTLWHCHFWYWVSFWKCQNKYCVSNMTLRKVTTNPHLTSLQHWKGEQKSYK